MQHEHAGDGAQQRPTAGDPPAVESDEAVETIADDEVEIIDAELVEDAATGDDSEAQEKAEAGETGDERAETELEVAVRERAEYLDLAQRARAELENYRRRVSGEAQTAERRGRAAVARDLIPALDNLERALVAAGVDPEGSSAPSNEPISQEVSAQVALAEGVGLVYRELRDGLRRAGVEAFDPVGEKFDPNHHEAIATGAADGVAPGHVVEVLEKGYALGDTVLRPARVIVSG
jgi:molecular chaperone GrpE